jgi:hypothetical protein
VSDFAPPPPPPPSGGTPPPPPFASAEPPPPPRPFAVATQAPTDTGGLRKACIALFWVATGAAALLLIALIARRVAWSNFTRGEASLSDLRDADDFVGGASFILFVLVLASLIVVSIWSLRTARHAKATGAGSVSPGLACGGWYIPFANAIVPFVQLRKVVRHRGRATTTVNLWQGMLIGVWVVSVALRGVSNSDENTVQDLTTRLTSEVVLGSILLAGMAVTAAIAMRALRDIDGT